MSSLFDGTPVTAATSSQSLTQTPQWLRDAVYNQVQNVQNVAALPMGQYNGQLVAGPTGNQQAAWNAANQNLSMWQPASNAALGGLQNLAQQPGGVGIAQQYVDQALQQPGGLQAAQQYMNAAGQGAAGGISNYMNPYNQQVTDQIARLGARNLTENLLPGISDQFVQAGQFGGSRMGEFGSRALRDTQEAILGEQARALQSGYNTALGASQGDISTQLQLGQLAGNLGGQGQQNAMNAAQLLGGLTNQDISTRAGLYGNILSGGADAMQNAATMGEQERQIQQLGNTANYEQFLRAQQYPQQQTNWLTQQLGALHPMVPNVQTQNSVAPVGMAPSPASILAGGLSGIAGLLNQ